MKTRLVLRRTAATAITMGVLYSAFGFLAVPAILKHQASAIARDTLHRQLTIEQVAFNPYTLALSVDGIKLLEPHGGQVFFSSERIAVDLAGQSLWRLAPVVQQLSVTKPYVHLVRDQAGRYSIDDILARIASTPPSPEPARFSINNIALDGGQLVFEDQPARATHRIDGLRLGIPSLSSMPADVHVFVQPLLSASVNGAPLLLKGKVRPFAEPKDMALELRLDNVDLPRYLDYLPFKPAFKLGGAKLDAAITASFRQPHEQGPALVLGGTVGVKDVSLSDAAGAPVLAFKTLDVALGTLDVFAGKFALERIAVDGLDASIARDAQGRLNLDQLGGPPPPPPVAPAPGKRASERGIAVSLKNFSLRGAGVRYAEPGIHADGAGIDLDVQDLALDTGNKTVRVGAVRSDSAKLALRRTKAVPARSAPPSAEAPYQVDVATIAVQGWSVGVDDRTHEEALTMSFAPLAFKLDGMSSLAGTPMTLDLHSGAGKNGTLAAAGTLTLSPLHVALAIDADRVSLLPLQPYATESVNLRLTQALLSSKGKLTLQENAKGQMTGGYTGDASIDRLAAVDKASASDFVSWKALSLGGMDLQLAPFALSINKVTLADFFARVIIDPNGRINLQDVRRTAATGERSLTDAAERASDPVAAVPTPPAAAAPVVAAAAEPLPPIRINSLVLSGGRVRFTDNFIRPNYSASLQDVGGTVSGLSSASDANANVSLRGVVNGAPLSIAGLINPLKRDLFLDIKADVRGVELSTLSAYSDKYVGYGIDKGKLSFEVAYRLDKRQLTSENRLILDQLTFGNENTNPEVKKLPVRLAVALLSDRNGIIDISVPVGGTLDDPEFSISGIVLKIIGNAIVKTVTSPFALLASAFGGGDQLSTLEFDPGRATIPASGEAKLGALAKALLERPGLKLDIAGHVDPAKDSDALKQVSLERKVRAIKTRDLQDAGADMPSGGVVVSKEEYPALLARAFKAETFKKPRNVIGLDKALPVPEMEQLMIANVQVSRDDLQALARRRSQAAKDWLIKTGKVPDERVYIVAAHDGDAADKSDQAAAPRVDFALR